jgi:alpha-glucosidase
MRLIAIIALFLFSSQAEAALVLKPEKWSLKSPDGRIELNITYDARKQLQYSVRYNGSEVLETSSLGVIFDNISFSTGYRVTKVSPPRVVSDTYTMLQGKRSKISYRAIERTFSLSSSKENLDIVFRVSNDGVAFRYGFGDSGQSKSIISEATTFNLPDNAVGYLQPMSKAKTGWSRVNPCYEEHYESGIPVSKASAFKQGWVYPALFESNGVWLLISEAGLDKNYCGTHLSDPTTDGIYSVAFPQPEEFLPGGGINPIIEGKNFSPWRLITIGSLNTIVESTMGTDLAPPSRIANAGSFVKPGHASWSWALLKDDSIVYDVQKRFIDYASDMHWAYCLIDVNWDSKIGYDKIRELAAYAAKKNVGLILWYNSAGSWNDAPYTPRNTLITRDSRLKEFARLKEMGIKGVKIDFFGGDGQSFIHYYQEILEDAAAFGLMVNVHGSTLPRGWQRTYPNLVSSEAVKGFEYVTFEQVNADLQPSHCAMLPFTRNVFDPMDFTPLSLYKVPNIERKTTSAFELALPVIFLSGIQHFVETPDGMSKMPEQVINYLRDLPASWDETRFISGHPGREVVLARRSGSKWYVAGINARSEKAKMKIDVSVLGKDLRGYMLKDGGQTLTVDQSFVQGSFAELEVPAFGGFVIVLGDQP